jgi:triphosphoribosyl-dephospho-CoA synthase
MSNSWPGEPESLPLAVGQCAALATIMEATAAKPGNVYRGADFEDLSYPDFVVSATLLAPIFELAPEMPLGHTILTAVKVTRRAVATNANLGTILLLAPLAKVPRSVPLAAGVVEVLKRLNAQDSSDVYEAIRCAKAGGLGRVEAADVAGDAPASLIDAMRLAAERDMVARQYAENFATVLDVVVPSLAEKLASGMELLDAIVRVHVELMSQFPDSLIARRCGQDVARESAARAGRVLASGRPGNEDYQRELADLDFWLRAKGHERNPGTTADLVAAGLFAALRDDIIKPPFRLAKW